MLSLSSPPLLRPAAAAAAAPPRAASAAALSPRASSAASAAAFAPFDASPRACTPPPSPPSPHRVLLRHGMPPACSSLYEVLGIPVAATCQEIKVAYRRLARSCHPDAAAAAAAVDRNGASADEFMRIHAAYSTLSDPEKRAVYDSSLFRRRSRPLTAVASGGGGGYRGRNWETDQCW